MNNYEYCAQWAVRRAGPGGKVLDYGCGGAEVVTKLRSQGIDAWGCDAYYEGVDLSHQIDLKTRPFVLRMHDDLIPFDDATFDCIISNQVIEHIRDLPLAAAEMARVLKPGGCALHIFPHKGVWREGHSNVPFLHWFPESTASRIYYAAAVRAIKTRFGSAEKTPLEWGRHICAWLDQWTHYRSAAEIRRVFARHGSIEHIEDQWFDARFGSRHLPAALKRWLTHCYSGMVVVLQSRA